MQLKYHDKAVENGVYVVGACGFDSIPADMGQVLLLLLLLLLLFSCSRSCCSFCPWCSSCPRSPVIRWIMIVQVCVKQAMGGDVNSVETYLKVIVPPLPGAAINFGTWQVGLPSCSCTCIRTCTCTIPPQSAIHGFAHAGELKSLRKAIYPER